jgi:ribosome-binding protein aMBF1 (putative translation factor)
MRTETMSETQTIRIAGTEYVVVPKADYLRLQRVAGVPPGSVDALEYADASIGRALRAARQTARLTQTELARRLGKSQPLIAGAESGRVQVSGRYVAAVLKACGLPKDWTPPKRRRRP